MDRPRKIGRPAKPKRYAECIHPHRFEWARRMCGTCYSTWFRRKEGRPVRVFNRMADCHPERRHKAKGMCSECYIASRKEAHQLSARKSHLRRTYGRTPEEIDAMFAAQRGLCGICEQRLVRKPHIDHDHATGLVRSLLCDTCNRGLGQFKDSPALLRVAADYIERHAAINALVQS